MFQVLIFKQEDKETHKIYLSQLWSEKRAELAWLKIESGAQWCAVRPLRSAPLSRGSQNSQGVICRGTRDSPTPMQSNHVIRRDRHFYLKLLSCFRGSPRTGLPHDLVYVVAPTLILFYCHRGKYPDKKFYI